MNEYEQAQALLEQQNNTLDDTINTGLQNIQIGVETDEMLQRQTEQLRGIDAKV